LQREFGVGRCGSRLIACDDPLVAALSRQLHPKRFLITRVPLNGANPTHAFDIISVSLMVAFDPKADALTFLESRKGASSL
jgi:hypothetical protein